MELKIIFVRLVNVIFWMSFSFFALVIPVAMYGSYAPSIEVDNDKSTINCLGKAFSFSDLGVIQFNPKNIDFTDYEIEVIHKACLYQNSTYILHTYTVGSWWEVLLYSVLGVSFAWSAFSLAKWILFYIFLGTNIEWLEVILPLLLLLWAFSLFTEEKPTSIHSPEV